MTGLRLVSLTGSTLAQAGASTVLGQASVPMIMIGSGLMVANGVGTATTALATTYPNAYCYFGLNAIASGVPAGWYYTVFTTSTAFTVFNNIYTSGTPTIPVSPTAFSTTSPVSYTGVSSLQASYVLAIPGNTLGINGGIRADMSVTYTNTAAAKTISILYDALTFMTGAFTTTAALAGIWGFKNRGTAGIQIGISQSGSPPFQSQSADLPRGTVDSTVAKNLVVNLTNGTPLTNNIVLESITIEFLPGVA